MRIAFVTIEDPADRYAWSGINFQMAESLRRAGLDVLPVGPLHEDRALYFKAKHLFKKARGQSYARLREPVIGRGFARQILQHLEGKQIDAIVSPGNISIAYLECRQPIITWADATFAALVNYYPDYQALSQNDRETGLANERQSTSKLAMSIFASNWAAQSAVSEVGIDPQRVQVVPFGAILLNPPDRSQVMADIESRSLDRCQLLFIGQDGARKGIGVAIAAAKALNCDLGMPCDLHVVGQNHWLPDWVKTTAFLDKYSDAGAKQLDGLLRKSHFLLLPSKAEAFGMAPCEANAYGVPALVSQTGGLTEVVRDGINGYSFPVEAPASQYAMRIMEALSNRQHYLELCRLSRKEYECRLNWEMSANKVKVILEEVIRSNA